MHPKMVQNAILELTITQKNVAISKPTFNPQNFSNHKENSIF